MGSETPVATHMVNFDTETTPLLERQSNTYNGENTTISTQKTVTHNGQANQKPLLLESSNDHNIEEGPLSSFIRVLYDFSTPTDHALRIIGFCAAIMSGVALPCMTLVFGSSVDEFNKFGSGEQSPSEMYQALCRNALWFSYLFIGRYVLVYIHASCFGASGIRATRAFRQQFIKSIMRQEIAYIDSCSLGGITSTISANVDMVENGITEKIGSLIQAISMLIAGFVVAFTQQWKLTLVTATTLPVLFAGFYITFSLDAKIEGKILEIYNSASGLAEEAISSTRMVTAFNIGKRLAQMYDFPLTEAQRLGLRKAPIIGFQYSVEMFTTYCAYALAWYYGTKLLNQGELSSSGDMITVLLSVLLATQAASDVAPGFSGFTRASASAKAMFAVVDRHSQIDSLSEQGLKPENSQKSDVQLHNVTFAYPSRPNIPILQDFSITFEAGKTTALVGASGCGKSTIVGLIERWFDTDSGSVLVGGHAVTDLNVRWLRSQIGLVQQEPVLFSDSIYKNVAHGLYGTTMDSLPEAEKRELVRQACVQAFADDFIQALPEKYETLVGERGQLLSGGQKQRIAIARVIISNPSILLLDEATSALDPTAERNVQAALDNVSKSRTTIIIAHKLSTVQKADKIVVLSHGKVVEEGTHQELLIAKGSYHKLVHSQRLDNDKGVGHFEDSQDTECSRSLENEMSDATSPVQKPHHFSKSGNETSASGLETNSTPDEENEELEGSDITKKLSLIRCIYIIIFQEQRHIWFLFFAGLVSSAGSGGAFPAQAVLFGKSISTLSLPPGQLLVDEGNLWALAYFILGLSVLVTYWGVGFWWTAAAARATRQYRREYFESMLHQDVAFFDGKGHSAAEMTSRLSQHPLHLQSLLSTNLALMILTFFNVAGCCILSLAVSWELAVPVMFVGVPLLFGAGYFRMRMEMSNQDRVTAIYQEAARFASEAVGAFRTVSSLGLENKIIDGYEERLSESARIEMRHKLLSMLLFAFSESISLAVSAFSFWYGGKLLSEGKCSVTTFFIVFIAISMGMQTAGFMFGFTSDLSKAHISTNYIIDLRRSRPLINSSAVGYTDWQAPEPENDFALEFRDVSFSYPTRPDVPVLRNFNLKIRKGESVGIVGASGCGKSTIISLLERFYDVEQGQLLIGGVPLHQLDVQHHRSRLGLVSQDTTLYQGSIRDNILLGKLPSEDACDDSDSQAKADEAILQACKLAQIHDFILSLPEGYHTNLGSHGMSLSGGQRQRLAIARALIREPEILLFDEATSALDSQSEALVQQAFEAITSNNDSRTVISVAHRLSTIKQCDRIFVLHRGQVVEEGTHEDLFRRRGRYYEMVLAQTLDTEA